MEFIQNLTMMQRLMGVAGVVLVVVLLLILNKRQKSSGASAPKKTTSSAKKSGKRGRRKKGSDDAEDDATSTTTAPAVARMVPRLPAPGSVDPLADEFGQAQTDDDDDWAPVEGSWETADSDMSAAAETTNVMAPLSEPDRAADSSHEWSDTSDDFDPATGWSDVEPAASDSDAADGDDANDWSTSSNWESDDVAKEDDSNASDPMSADMNEWGSDSADGDVSEWSNSVAADTDTASEWLPVDEADSGAVDSDWASPDAEGSSSDESDSDVVSDISLDDQSSFDDWNAGSDVSEDVAAVSDDPAATMTDIEDSETPSFSDWGTDAAGDSDVPVLATASYEPEAVEMAVPGDSWTSSTDWGSAPLDGDHPADGASADSGADMESASDVADSGPDMDAGDDIDKGDDMADTASESSPWMAPDPVNDASDIEPADLAASLNWPTADMVMDDVEAAPEAIDAVAVTIPADQEMTTVNDDLTPAHAGPMGMEVQEPVMAPGDDEDAADAHAQMVTIDADAASATTAVESPISPIAPIGMASETDSAMDLSPMDEPATAEGPHDEMDSEESLEPQMAMASVSGDRSAVMSVPVANPLSRWVHLEPSVSRRSRTVSPLRSWSQLAPAAPRENQRVSGESTMESPSPVAEPSAWWDSSDDDSARRGRFALGGYALRPGHQVVSGVTFRDTTQPPPSAWVIGPVDGPVASGTLEIRVDGCLNCRPEDIVVLMDRGFEPTPDGFSLRLSGREQGPFAASGTFVIH